MNNWIAFCDKTPLYGQRFIYKGNENGIEYHVRTWSHTDIQCWQGWSGSYWLPLDIPDYPDSDERALRAWITKNRPSTHVNFDDHARQAWYAALDWERNRK